MSLIVLSKRKFFCLIAIFISAILLVTASALGISGVFGKANKKQLPIYRVKTQEKKVAISFDCAWGVEFTDKLLEIMQEEDVKCTFFAVEFWTKKYPEYVKKIVSFGHEMGTHSATHPYMSKLNKEAIKKELESSINQIERITGQKVELFRPPYGDYSDSVIESAKDMGLFTIQWDVDSLDWKNLSASEIEKRVVERVKEGSIVLFHNNGLHTAEALPSIIKSLKQKGFEFVKISELIYRDNYYMAHDGEQILNS